MLGCTYAFNVATPREQYVGAQAEDLNLEQRCCPFMRFVIEIEPEHGPLWLRWTGPHGTKEFLRLAFEGADLIDPEVARAAGLDTSSRRRVSTVPEALAMVEINGQFAASANGRLARVVWRVDCHRGRRP
jgi:hypothetical protein